MKSESPISACFSKVEGEFSFSGPVLLELIRAVFEKDLPFRFRANGFSMSPFIKDGDVVTVSPLLDVTPRLGDVVAFIRPEAKKLVIHRVLGKKGDACIINGDNNFAIDGLIPKANILGCVKTVERDGRRVNLGLGPERRLIAFLARTKLLWPLMTPVWRLVRPLFRRNAR